MIMLDEYYSILQVHFLAEPEVIEGAYKRLAKKYHPDVNKEIHSEIKMKKLNEAYETLKDPEKRKKYDAQLFNHKNQSSNEKSHQTKETEEICVIQAKFILNDYFELIRNKNFVQAYKLLSIADKNKISEDDFLKWQSNVSKIYQLQNYHCMASKIENSIVLNNIIYKQSIEFIVKTSEYNTVMGRLENDIINKTVVFEKGDWRVFLGYEDISPYIARFEILNGLLLEKSAIDEIVSLNSNKDHVSGLLNKKGFVEAIEKEIWRNERYGNTFSLILIDIEYVKNISKDKINELKNYSFDYVSEILKKSLRKLDLVAVWGETEFIVLMCETDLRNSIKASFKIKKAFEKEKTLYNNIFNKIVINMGIEEYNGSLEKSIGNLNHYVATAKKFKDNSIVSAYGLHK